MNERALAAILSFKSSGPLEYAQSVTKIVAGDVISDHLMQGLVNCLEKGKRAPVLAEMFSLLGSEWVCNQIGEHGLAIWKSKTDSMKGELVNGAIEWVWAVGDWYAAMAEGRELDGSNQMYDVSLRIRKSWGALDRLIGELKISSYLITSDFCMLRDALYKRRDIPPDIKAEDFMDTHARAYNEVVRALDRGYPWWKKGVDSGAELKVVDNG